MFGGESCAIRLGSQGNELDRSIETKAKDMDSSRGTTGKGRDGC